MARAASLLIIPDSAVAITKAPTGHSTPCEELCPQCGYARSLELAVERLFAEWDAARTPPQCVAPADLAMQFVRDLRRYPDITTEPIPHNWVRTAYPPFCRSRGAVPVPAYKHFANALGKLMPRKRVEGWRRGKPKSCTGYTMPEVPTTNVVQLTRPGRGIARHWAAARRWRQA